MSKIPEETVYQVSVKLETDSITLEDLFNEVRDIDECEPSCIDKVLSFLEDLTEESEKFMKILTKKLKFVIITWQQPWYQQSVCLTRPFKDVAVNNEDTYRTGTMTTDEIKVIEKNWRKFVKKYEVPDKLICLARWRNLERSRHTPEEIARIYVVAFLARGLKRTMSQVYSHIVSYYGAPNKGHYNIDEEKVMKICLQHCPKKAATILTTVLAREKRGIYKWLYYAINGKPPKKRLKWTLPLASKFVKLLMEYTGEPLDDLKFKKFDKDVWVKLENQFEKQKEYLQHFWYTKLHSQIFVKCNVTLKKLRRKVFKVLRSSPYKVWSDIRWKEVQNKFPDGFTYQFLYWTTVRLFRSHKQHTRIPLQDLVEHGLKITGSKHRTRRNRRLKTLVLNGEGELEVQQYSTKLQVEYF